MIDRLEISNSKKNAREFLKLPTGSAEELSNRPKVTFVKSIHRSDLLLH